MGGDGNITRDYLLKKDLQHTHDISDITSADEEKKNTYLGFPDIYEEIADSDGMIYRDVIQMSFDDPGMNFTISVPYYNYWFYINGEVHIIETDITINFSAVAGNYYIYFNIEDDLRVLSNPTSDEIRSLIVNGIVNEDPAVYIAYIYSNGTKAVHVAAEYHSYTRNKLLHYKDHNTIGTLHHGGGEIDYDGALGGALDDDIQVFLSDDPIYFDEDLMIKVFHDDAPSINWQQQLRLDTAGIKALYAPIVYKALTVWEIDAATKFPMKWNTTVITYNNVAAGTQVAVATGDYSYVYIVETNDVNEPIIILQGHSSQANVNLIKQDAIQNLDNLRGLNLPMAEYKVMYALLLLSDTSTGNSRECRIEEILDLRDNSFTAMSNNVMILFDHNVYPSKQGGQANPDEYYHLTLAEQVSLGNIAALTTNQHVKWGGTQFIDSFKNETTTGLVIYAQSNVTASTTQAQGQQPLVNSRNNVNVVANANDVVTLPPALAGTICMIINSGANTLQIFPASGDNLGAGVDTSESLATGLHNYYYAYDATNWIKI